MGKRIAFLPTTQEIGDLVRESVSKNLVLVPSRKNMWASSAGVCIRHNTLLANQENWIGTAVHETPDAPLKMYAEIGKAIHKFYSDEFYHSGALLFNEYQLPDDINGLRIRGKIDDIILLNGKIIGVEIKSCGNNLPSTIKPKHRAQATIYEALTGIPFIVFYSSRKVKDNFYDEKIHSKQIVLNTTFEQRLQAIKLLWKSQLMVDAGQLAPIPFASKNEICGECPFVNVCWSKDIDEYNSSGNEFNALAEEKARETLAGTSKRRNGILSHIYKNGVQPNAQDILSGSWEDLITHIGNE